MMPCDLHDTYKHGIEPVNSPRGIKYFALRQPKIFIDVAGAPRRSPNRDILNNVSSAHNENVTLVFYAIAYPTPQFSWHKCAPTCTQITDGMKYKIVSEDLVSNLTVLNIQQSDYGSYQVVVSNTIGTAWIEHYNILRQAKPSVPGYFHYTQHLQNQTTVTFYWLPGDNGGSVQTFIIEYKTTGSQVWEQLSVVENTSTPLMNASVDNLSTGTEYQARIFARNKFGASYATDTITFLTPASTTRATHQSLSQVGCIVGAVVPGILLVGFISVLIFLRLTNHIHFTKKGVHEGLATASTTKTAAADDPANVTMAHYEALTPGQRSTSVYSSLQHPTSTDNRFAQRTALGAHDIELQEQSAYQNP
ncbi:hypothetical protein DPMN_150861 [Dreissena polymorpha]|uniref:Fibronectin type-III domain-containing protein n=1 Tax=Dreissena polymorpha TaxID=45954 RepID=A0A9D4J6D8_DREPO|nr:hypothetical protein DPMN_150861 [Dreissena polymorpha]